MVYFLATVLLGVRHALEDQETDGRVVVEKVSVGGQVVSNCQPSCLVFTMDHLNSIKDFTESNHPSLPSTKHQSTCPQSPATFVLLPQRDSFICLNMVGIVVGDSSFTQVVVGHLRSILVLFTEKMTVGHLIG